MENSGGSIMESKIKNTPTQWEDPVTKVHVAGVRHRAAWLGLIYDEAMKDGHADLVAKYMWDATYRYGFQAGERLKSSFQSDPIDCREFAAAFGENDHRGRGLQAVATSKTEDRVDLEYHGCPLLAAWQELGLDDETCRRLCGITMNCDTGIADALGLKFDLYETLADGVPCCKCAYYRK